MKRIRTILLVLVATIVSSAVALTILIATLNDDHYQWIAIWAAKYFAGLEVTVEGPFSLKLSSEPSITASKVRIRDVTNSLSVNAELGRLEIKVAILPIISGDVLIRHLLIHDATVSIVRRAESRAGASEPDKRPSHVFIPVFENVSLQNVHLTVTDENATKLVRLELKDYSLKNDGDGGRLYVKGQGTLNAREFEIEGQFGSLTGIKGDEPYPIDLRLGMVGLVLTMSGTIEDPIHGQGLNVHVVAEAGEMAHLLRIFNADFPNFDQLSLDAKIVGDASSPGLAYIQLGVSRASDFNLAVKGSIGNILTGKGTSLKVSGLCISKDILEMLLPEDLPEMNRLKGEGRIRDGDGVYVVESLKLDGSNEQGAAMKVEGLMVFSRTIGKVPVFRELDLHCELSSPTTASARFPAVDFLPELGAISAKGQVHLSEDLLRFEDLAVHSSHAQGLQVETVGTVQVPLGGANNKPVQIDLQARVTAPNMGAAKPLLSKQYLSGSGPLLGKARITGTSEELSIEDLYLTVGESGPVRMRWQGRIGHVPLSSGELPSDVDMVGSINADEASVLASLAAISLPHLGPLKTTFRFVEQEGVYGFKDIQLSMGSQESLWLKSTGSLDLAVKGGAISLRGFEGHISAGASDTSSLQSFLGKELPRFGVPQLEGQISGNMTKGTFEGTLRLGSSQFKTTVSHEQTKQRPHIVAKIAAPIVNLADLGFYTDKVEIVTSESESEAKHNKRLFSDKPLSFHALRAIDLSVSVDVDKLRGEGFVLNKLDFDMSLRDGKLQIAPAKVTYKSGFASIDFTIDAVGLKPQMALKVTAEDFNIGALLAYIHKPPSLKGQLNLFIDLQSAGNSPREIATVLGGEIGLAVEKGKIKRAVEVMGADAVDFLSEIRSRGEYKDLNCMALRFIFEEGIGKSEIVYIETSNMFARGGAHIDLHTETMKMILQPKPKKGLKGTTSAVVIEGPITDPKVRKLPFREAAKLYGEIFMPVVFLPLRALGYLWYIISKDKERESPCLIMRHRTEELN